MISKIRIISRYIRTIITVAGAMIFFYELYRNDNPAKDRFILLFIMTVWWLITTMFFTYLMNLRSHSSQELIERMGEHSAKINSYAFFYYNDPIEMLKSIKFIEYRYISIFIAFAYQGMMTTYYLFWYFFLGALISYKWNINQYLINYFIDAASYLKKFNYHLIETYRLEVPFIAFLSILSGLIAYSLYIFRCKNRILYGTTEILFGLISMINAINRLQPGWRELSFAKENIDQISIQAFASLYIIIRGLINVHDASGGKELSFKSMIKTIVIEILNFPIRPILNMPYRNKTGKSFRIE